MNTGSKPRVQIKRMAVGPMQNFSYLIGDIKSRQALLVDPAWEGAKILEAIQAEGWSLAGVVATHSHYDHVNALADILRHADVPVYVNKEELSISRSGGDIFVDMSDVARPVWDEEELKLGDTRARFLHTPGHSPGSQCLLVDDFLLTGDTLFIGACGRHDLPGGDAEALEISLKRIAQLPGGLTIYPGHDYGPQPDRKLDEEKRDNPFLQFDND